MKNEITNLTSQANLQNIARSLCGSGKITVTGFQAAIAGKTPAEVAEAIKSLAIAKADDYSAEAVASPAYFVEQAIVEICA